MEGSSHFRRFANLHELRQQGRPCPSEVEDGGYHVRIISHFDVKSEAIMTGLATGPHLDFRVQRRGQFLNFERLPLPPSDPVRKPDWDEFAAVRALSQMPQLASRAATLAKNATPARQSQP